MKITYQQLIEDSRKLAKKIPHEYRSVYGIPAGGLIPALIIADELGIALDDNFYPDTLIVDDIIDSGRTLKEFEGFDTAVLYRKPHSLKTTYHLKEIKGWIDLPHEELETGIAGHIVRILEYIGENPNREGLKETPERVARAYKEWFRGYRIEEAPKYKLFATSNSGIIVKKQLPFTSWCEHHLAIYIGHIDFGYIPNKFVTGISKIIRRFQYLSSRLTIQENLTEDLINDFCKEIKPRGAIIRITALHTCEGSRGVKVPDVPTITSSIRGIFSRDEAAKKEFFELIK